MSTEALSAPWTLPFGGGLLRLFDLLRRAIRHRSLTAEQHELLAQFDVLSGRICDPILQANAHDDFEQRLDVALLEGKELLALGIRLVRTVDAANLQLVLADTELPPSFEEVLGVGVAKSFRGGLRMAEIAAAEWVRVLANLPDDARDGALKSIEEHSGEFALAAYDTNISLDLRELFVSTLQSVLAMWTIIRAVNIDARPAPWLSLALAETFRRGQYDL